MSYNTNIEFKDGKISIKKKWFSLLSIFTTLFIISSVFYAPMYAAINQGFFKEEDINIDLSTGQGADAHMLKTQV